MAVEAFLVGHCGLTERQAALTSYHEYELRLKGQEEREQREWERARWMVWRQLSPYYKQGQAPRTPQAFFRFPWEVESREDMQERYERCKPTAAELEWLNRLTSKQKS